MFGYGGTPSHCLNEYWKQQSREWHISRRLRRLYVACCSHTEKEFQNRQNDAQNIQHGETCYVEPHKEIDISGVVYVHQEATISRRSYDFQTIKTKRDKRGQQE